MIAALSLITVPSGSTRVGTWASGLIFSRAVRDGGSRSRSPTGSSVKGSPYQTSCASTSAEPQ